MGGKALNKYNVFTERKNTEEFNQIGLEISQRIFIDLNLVTSVVKCFHTKETHGDLDLLINIPFAINVKWKDYIQKTFNPQAINCNGGVYSFDYENFQIDFIPIPELKWNNALAYFSYDPCGNIMGKTYHKFGLSYGWEGLYYKYRNFHGSNHSDILISNDIEKIFKFGGYDYDRYQLGFEVLEDIFIFCINGRYFDSEMFQFENLKHIDKKRNRKRVSYHIFLKYLEEHNIQMVYNFEKDKDKYLPVIDSYFPEAKLLEKLDALKKEDEINKLVSEKFNGAIVMTWLPDLNGKELGIAIGRFKSTIGEHYNNYILGSNTTKIKDLFMHTYNAYLNGK